MKQVEFLPEDYRRRRQRRYLHLVRRWLVLAMVLAVVLWWHTMNKQLQQELRHLVALRTSSNRINAEVENVTRMDRERASFERQRELIKKLSSRAQSPVSLLAELVEHQPLSVRMSHQEIVSGPPNEGSSHTEVHLSGYAPDEIAVVQYLNNLGKSRQFREVTLEHSKSLRLGRQRLQTFKISLTAASPSAEQHADQGAAGMRPKTTNTVPQAESEQ
ncbi:MAG: PilN domain-containing protein [Planctomycetia bacterium]|nr:PilN domain-containing protein [Planctomycetia bacterium]